MMFCVRLLRPHPHSAREFMVLMLLCGVSSAFILLSSPSQASSRQYEAGRTFSYDYTTTVLLDEPHDNPGPEQKDVGYQLKARVTLRSIWQHEQHAEDKLLQINVKGLITIILSDGQDIPTGFTNSVTRGRDLEDTEVFIRSRRAPAPSGFIPHTSNLSSSPDSYPLFIRWVGGKIKEVFSIAGDLTALVNLKKGVASLFQYQLTSGEVEEQDSSGTCRVQYEASLSSGSLKKFKGNCSVPFLERTVHPNLILSADVDSSVRVSYVLRAADPILEKAVARESHSLKVHAWNQAGVGITAEQQLVLSDSETGEALVRGSSVDEVIKGLSSQMGVKIVKEKHGLLPADENAKCAEKCLPFPELVDEVRVTLRDTAPGSLRVARVILNLVIQARFSSKATLLNTVRSKKNEAIVAHLLDALGAAQTFPAHEAAMEFIDISAPSSTDLAERYLWSLSQGSHVPLETLEDLLRHSKQGSSRSNLKLFETLILTIATVCHRIVASGSVPQSHRHGLYVGLRSYARGASDGAVIQDVRQFLSSRLESCSDDQCRILFLRALKNDPISSNLDSLLRFVTSGSRKRASSMTHRRCHFFARYDTSVRGMAADLLLQADPTEELLRSLILSFESQDDHEVNTFVRERLYDLSHRDHRLNQLLSKVMQDRRVYNYNILAQRGVSTAFTRYFYDEGPLGNASFSVGMEMAGGLVKRMYFNVAVEEPKESLTLLTLSVFTGGLSSFSSSDEEPDPEELEESANGGLDLTLTGTQLRPFMFFEGQGELMGHIWSGTGSERTPALQSSFILHDHQQKLPLGNGLMAALSLLGITTVDFAGQGEVSLWYKTAHCLVDNRAAFLLRGMASVDTSFVQSQVETKLGGELGLALTTDLDFSGKPVHSCNKMTQSPFVLRHTVRKYEHIVGQQHLLRRILRRQKEIPGRTFQMNRKNTEHCNYMHKDEDSPES
ncbi:unnamed protein product [Cyprideis torosa]|uniref:Uncharacterized protein n=1 Tax=Cyprideis torosa TaxID=163714 RepID=A0A7R8W632_9CRUS|nr:unnamed protein product [Cyprideis torosa]CAG0886035.1 unnamed protein product [Cyprideis torosa]